MNTLLHDIKARQRAREMAKPQSFPVFLWALMARSWHHAFSHPRFTRISNR